MKVLKTFFHGFWSLYGICLKDIRCLYTPFWQQLVLALLNREVQEVFTKSKRWKMEPHINDVHKKDLNILFFGSIFRYASIHFSAAGLKSLNHRKGQKKRKTKRRTVIAAPKWKKHIDIWQMSCRFGGESSLKTKV